MNTILFYNPLTQVFTQLTESGNIVMDLKHADKVMHAMTLEEKEKNIIIKSLLEKYAEKYPMIAAYNAQFIK